MFTVLLSFLCLQQVSLVVNELCTGQGNLTEGNSETRGTSWPFITHSSQSVLIYGSHN